MTTTGWTPRELDLIPWPEALDLLDYWAENPPLHVLAKRAFKVWFQVEDEPNEEPEYVQLDEAGMANLVRMLNGGMV